MVAVWGVQACLEPQPDPSLLVPERELVLEGPLLKVTRRGKAQRCFFWLFSDIIVYGEPLKSGM